MMLEEVEKICQSENGQCKSINDMQLLERILRLQLLVSIFYYYFGLFGSWGLGPSFIFCHHVS